MTDEALKMLGLLIPYYKPHTTFSHRKPWSKRLKKPRKTAAQKKKHLADLITAPVPQLFQNNPDEKAFGLYRPSGWTRSLEGYFRSARRRLKVILKNNRAVRRRLTHEVTVNLTEPRHPEFINRDFRAFLKTLEKRGLAGHWTIHIDRKNVVHWHLGFQNYQGKPQSLKRLVQRCLKEVETFPKHRVYADQIKNQRQFLEYVLRVKKTGYGEVVNPLDKTQPRRSPVRYDLYAGDRLLFKSNTGLAKNGTFGDFWAKQANGKPHNEKTLWQLIRTETATVEANYRNPRLYEQVAHLHKYFGILLARAKWSVCLDPAPDLSRSPPQRKRQRRPSSGLVATVFPTRRHGIPVLKPRHDSRRLLRRRKASEIGRIGSPANGPIRRPQERLLEPSFGVLRDTKEKDGRNRLSAAMFGNEQFSNSRRNSFELGP